MQTDVKAYTEQANGAEKTELLKLGPAPRVEEENMPMVHAVLKWPRDHMNCRLEVSYLVGGGGGVSPTLYSANKCMYMMHVRQD